MAALEIGIRREDKSRWERRVPLTPAAIGALMRRTGMRFRIQPSAIRVFDDQEYAAVGATVSEDLSGCGVVLGVKEMPPSFFQEAVTYLFFSHTVKGQRKNMPMLRRMMELRASLLDYELIKDGEDRRLIFFGHHAGTAGMIDSLWALGRRLLEHEALSTPFLDLKPAHAYAHLGKAKQAVREVGNRIRREGLPDALRPLVCGFTGYGNVSRGAQEIFDLLPVRTLEPSDLLALKWGDGDAFCCTKVVFKEEHMARPRDPGERFELRDYYEHPRRYEGCFSVYPEHLTMLINCIYWDERYPRLLSKALLRRLCAEEKPSRLRLVGDISCDIDGSVEATVKSTDQDSPVFVYDGATEAVRDGFAGPGVAIVAIDNLPCELPRESSEEFSAALELMLQDLARVGFQASLSESGLPPELLRSAILWKGELTANSRHLARHLAAV